MPMNADDYALYRQISDFSVDQLLWRILYINSELSGQPNAQSLANKLMAVSQDEGLIIVDTCPQKQAVLLADSVNRSNQLFIAYVKSMREGGNTEELCQKWEQNNYDLAELLQQAIPGQVNWHAMLKHECDLLQKVIDDVNAGKFKTLTDITPLLRRLAADMADYYASGVLHDHKEE